MKGGTVLSDTPVIAMPEYIECTILHILNFYLQGVLRELSKSISLYLLFKSTLGPAKYAIISVMPGHFLIFINKVMI